MYIYIYLGKFHYDQHRSMPLEWTALDGGFEVTHPSVYPGGKSKKYQQWYKTTLKFPVSIL